MRTQEMEHGEKISEKSRYDLIEGVFERVEALSPRTFATAAALSVGSSLLLRLMGRRHDAIFVGEWAPTLLMMGLYTKAMSEARRGLSEGTGARGSSGEVAHYAGGRRRIRVASRASCFRFFTTLRAPFLGALRSSRKGIL